MPNANSDVVAKYADVRRAVLLANHESPKSGSVDRTIADLERYLERPMRVVVLGEHNTGKTALINALLGRDVLPTAVIANTPVPVTMRYAPTCAIRAQTDCGTWHDVDRAKPFEGFDVSRLRAVEVRAPNPLLKRFELVDTPASDEPKENILGADFVIWCTNATRAWSETERRIWMGLPRRCRRFGILAATHADNITSLIDRERVLMRLQDVAGDMFEDIQLVSSVTHIEDERHEGRNAHCVSELLHRLDEMAKDQRARRVQAANRIASRLNRAIRPANGAPRKTHFAADTQLAS